MGDRLSFIPTRQMPDDDTRWKIFQRVENYLPSYRHIKMMGHTLGYAPMDFSDAEEKHLGNFLNRYPLDFVAESRTDPYPFVQACLDEYHMCQGSGDGSFNTVIFSNPRTERLLKPILNWMGYLWQRIATHTLQFDAADWVWFGYLAEPVEGPLGRWDEVDYLTNRGSALLRVVTPLRHIGNGVVSRGVGFHTPVMYSGRVLRFRQEGERS